MTEIVPRVEFVHPYTGELFDLTVAKVDDLAGMLDSIRAQEDMAKDAKRMITDELLQRMDTNARWTERAGQYEIKGSSPAPTVEFDAPRLHEALYQLVEAGTITVEAADAAVETVVSYKAKRAGINALRKLGATVAHVIDEHASEIHKTRYVTVTPKGQR